jgi:hypothetical protein
MRRRRASRTDFDSPWKEALEYFLAPFLAFFFPQIHRDIDWSRGYESLNKEFQKIARAARSRRAYADALFKVWRLNGEESWLLIHIEVQGEPEQNFPLRMFRYNVRVFDRYNQTVVSLAVLTDERLDWRPERFEYGDWGASTGIRFLTSKLIDWRGREAELEVSTNPFARVVLAHVRAIDTRQDPEGRRRYKIQLVKGLYRFGWNAEDVRQLFRVIDWMLALPGELEQGFQEDLHEWEEEKRMPYITSVERYGMEKGRQEGRRQELQAAIATALGVKFGSAGKRLATTVRKVTDIGELRALYKATLVAETLPEIRERLASQRPS